MTIGKAIDVCNRLRPNQYKRIDMLRWLSEVDGRIFTEIHKVHINDSDESFEENNADTPEDTELLAPFPYDNLYVHYLCAMIDYFNSEYARYNNGMMQFNEVYSDYSRWYNRTHLTKDIHIKLQG